MDTKLLLQKLFEVGFTQGQIANFVGCSQPTISDISRGKIRNPSFEIGMALLDLARKNHIEVPEEDVS